MTLRVVKVGGSALADLAWLRSFAAEMADSPLGTVVVHGGGPEISALADRLGVGFGWNNGRRVTTDQALDVVAMVLNGRVNKRLVSALVTAGRDAVGLSGEDGGLLVADIAEGGALGRVGAVESVRTELLNMLLEREITPVISPVARAVDGGSLNVNADDAAAAIAHALGADELLFLTDVAGVMAGGSRVEELDAGAATDLVAAGVATGGMAVKVTAAVAALEAGVAGVRIGGLDMLGNAAAGTRIVQTAGASA